MYHDHDDPSEFEAGCPACELDEVSLQDTGRRWSARAIEHPAPGQRRQGGAAA